ncbi:MAG: hypothetical protein H6707_19060 [Deltaproteobacteria bacterium]|nr:hypothetical protein [Deltaproteobacteria bacterium]
MHRRLITTIFTTTALLVVAPLAVEAKARTAPDAVVKRAAEQRSARYYNYFGQLAKQLAPQVFAAATAIKKNCEVQPYNGGPALRLDLVQLNNRPGDRDTIYIAQDGRLFAGKRQTIWELPPISAATHYFNEYHSRSNRYYQDLKGLSGMMTLLFEAVGQVGSTTHIREKRTLDHYRNAWFRVSDLGNFIFQLEQTAPSGVKIDSASLRKIVKLFRRGESTVIARTRTTTSLAHLDADRGAGWKRYANYADKDARYPAAAIITAGGRIEVALERGPKSTVRYVPIKERSLGAIDPGYQGLIKALGISVEQ